MKTVIALAKGYGKDLNIGSRRINEAHLVYLETDDPDVFEVLKNRSTGVTGLMRKNGLENQIYLTLFDGDGEPLEISS